MGKSSKSNDQLLKHIISYANQIDEANQMFNADKNDLKIIRYIEIQLLYVCFK